MSVRIARSKALSSIPQRKVVQILENTLRTCDECSQAEVIKLHSACTKCSIINKAYRRYAESNIPIRYWKLDMGNFKGDATLFESYKNATDDLSKTYDDGQCMCFAGSHGLGKTLTCANILKRAAEKGYSCLYVTLSDIVANAVHGPLSEKFVARKELITVDFLVIDEFDPRHMQTGASSDLFGRQIEDIFRKRSENQLPLFMCTNSPNVVESFQGSIKCSIESLMNYAQIIPVIGADFRRNE